MISANKRIWDFSFLLVLVGFCLLTGCGGPNSGSGNLVTKWHKGLEEFRHVHVNTSVLVDIVLKDKTLRVGLSIDDNLVEKTTVKVIELDGFEEKVLKIDVDKKLSPSETPRITLTLPFELKSIMVAGTLSGKINNIHGENLDVDCRGSESMVFTGEITNFNLTVDGSGEFKADNLSAENVTVQVEGDARIVVNAKNKLTAELGGSSELSYVGDPKDIEKTVSKNATLKKAP